MSAKAALVEAAAELRGTAEAIRAVERAAGASASDNKSTTQRAGLLDAVAALRGQLDEGVAEVCGLVTAAGAVVAAARPETRPAALTEATDRLTGLADGLRELRPRSS